MASSSANTRTYPKRKRATISYEDSYDEVSDEPGIEVSEVGSEVDSDLDEAPAKKVCRLPVPSVVAHMKLTVRPEVQSLQRYSGTHRQTSSQTTDLQVHGPPRGAEE